MPARAARKIQSAASLRAYRAVLLSINFQCVALAAPDGQRVDGHHAQTELCHNGFAADAQQLALLDLLARFDLQIGQAIEDAFQARAVVMTTVQP